MIQIQELTFVVIVLGIMVVVWALFWWYMWAQIGREIGGKP